MELREELTDELHHFYNGFASWESSVIRSSDLTVSEVHAIEVLGHYGQMSMKDLAQKLGVTTGTVTVTVDRLEKKEYARRGSAKEDRRIYLISLTDKGREAHAVHHSYHLRLTDHILASLSEDEAGQLLKIFKKINSEIL